MPTPEWVTETPGECVYQLLMCGDDGQPAQEVYVSRGEYIGLKRHLAAVRSSRAVEVDVKSPSFQADRLGLEVCVRLEALHPGDPGELSGACLRIAETGELCFVQAEIGNHSLGNLAGAALAKFSTALGDRDIEGELAEVYPKITGSPSGMVIKITGSGAARKLTLMAGAHCFGTTSGDDMQSFLSCLRSRLALGTPPRKAPRARG